MSRYTEGSYDEGLLSALLEALEDGADTAATLAMVVGLTEERITQALAMLVELGVPLTRVGEQVKLSRSLDRLDSRLIRAALGSDSDRIGALEVFLRVSSTNDYLLAKASELPRGPCVCTAEVQTSGRGRRGRAWVSPFAANLYFSMLRRWREGVALGGMSIALGVAVAELLYDIGATTVGIKWPNDLVAGGRKLGGLLVDVAGDPRRGCDVVAGIGINVHMLSEGSGSQIDQPWCTLAELLAAPPSRSALAADVTKRWLSAFDECERRGLDRFLPRFARFDLCLGKPVTVHMSGEVREGIARGINADGALLLERDGRIETHYAADVSLRAPSQSL